MAKKLVIVESPAKARTISKILGKEFDVTSSMGHLIDLPTSRLGVNVEGDFEPHYIVIRKRLKIAKQLRMQARKKEAIYLATDPDREGEAISWHLAKLLRDDEAAEAEKAKKKAAKAQARQTTKRRSRVRVSKGAPDGRKIYRVTFEEITPEAVQAAMRRPGEIDIKKVDAQQARRILDRLVGYSLSPLLWKKVRRGLSAGRVQSVALRVVVDREREIEAFVPREYWTIDTELKKPKDAVSFKAQLEKIGDRPAEIKTRQDAERIAGVLQQCALSVAHVEAKEQKHYPRPPFTTSTLQQEAFNKLGFSAARTMRIAQQLYEGLDIAEAGPVGLITYMRTDSVRVADGAGQALRSFITEAFGASFCSPKARVYKSRKTAQEAHEAIRPTQAGRAPDSLRAFLSKEQMSLYQLIWQRFVASQMSDAVDHVVSVQIDARPPAQPAGRPATPETFRLKSTGRTNLFAGWTKVYQETGEEQAEDGKPPEGVLPLLVNGDALELVTCMPNQHFTKPPPRYTDASLVRVLEENGIGRPSTYAPTIMTIVSRDYVRRIGRSLVPTTLGRLVTDLLIEHFPEVMDVTFTAGMEEELDRIEEGDLEWVSVVRQFYTPFASRVATAQEKMREVKREAIPTQYICEKCGKQMVIKWGRFGQFLSCSDYPECKHARSVPTGVSCPQANCGGGLVERRSRGRVFYGCSNYPTCTYTTQRLPVKEDEEG